MNKMQELSELLSKELDKYAEKRSMTAGDLDIVYKLSDSIKNLYKIDMLEGGGYDDESSMYSGYGRGTSMARGRGENYSNNRYSMNGYSNRRGYSRDDGYSSRRGYSGHDEDDDLMEYLGESMRGASEEKKKILKDAMRKLEEMK